MKVEIDNVPYKDNGHIKGAKSVLEAHGFGLVERKLEGSAQVVLVDIYNELTDPDDLDASPTLIGRITRNFDSFGDYKIAFEHPTRPNRGTGPRVGNVVKDLLTI